MFKTQSQILFLFKRQAVYFDVITADIDFEKSKLIHVKRPTFDPAIKCPEFNKMLKQVFNLAIDTDGMVRHFFEFAGYHFYKSHSMNFNWILTGTNSTGKHEIFNIISKCFEPDTDRLENVKLKTKPSNKTIHTDAQIENTMVIPFFGNLSNTSKVYSFDNIIKFELSGVINEIFAGLQRLIKRGEFDVPIDCENAKKKYLASINHIDKFLKATVVPVSDFRQRVNSYDLYCIYLNWSGLNGYKMRKRDFTREIQSRGYTYKQGVGKWAFFGMALIVDNSV